MFPQIGNGLFIETEDGSTYQVFERVEYEPISTNLKFTCRVREKGSDRIIDKSLYNLLATHTDSDGYSLITKISDIQVGKGMLLKDPTSTKITSAYITSPIKEVYQI